MSNLSMPQKIRFGVLFCFLRHDVFMVALKHYLRHDRFEKGPEGQSVEGDLSKEVHVGDGQDRRQERPIIGDSGGGYGAGNGSAASMGQVRAVKVSPGVAFSLTHL